MLHCRRHFTHIFIKKVRARHIYKTTPSMKRFLRWRTRVALRVDEKESGVVNVFCDNED